MNRDYETEFDVNSSMKNSLSKRYTNSTMCKHSLYTAICSKCFNMKGRINYRAFQTVFVEVENECVFTDKEVENEIMKIAPDLWESKLKCQRCKRLTKHFWADELIAPLIQTLNISGYNTIYSCEGHSDGYRLTSYNYILIDGHHANEFIEKFEKLDNWRVMDTFMELKNGKRKDVMRLSIDETVPYANYSEEINKLIKELKEE